MRILHRRLLGWIAALGCGAGSACTDVVLDVSAPLPGHADRCTPGEDAPACDEALVCEPIVDSNEHVCAVAVELHGQVIDALAETPIQGALVAALDVTRAPVTDIVETDAEGRYQLPVSVARDAAGALAMAASWTLMASATGYQPFPAGLRQPLPLDTVDIQDGDPIVIENAATTVALIPRQTTGVTISGSVEGQSEGVLVVAEGASVPAPSTVTSLSGHFVLFDVPPGLITLRGYRSGLELGGVALTVSSQAIDDVLMTILSEDHADLGRVTGSVNIVDASGEKQTSVVLVPSSVFNNALERGPVPWGLRAPEPGLAPDVKNSFVIAGVPAGTYRVLAAFENDNLVRDPDESIAGTAIQEIVVAPGATVEVPETLKVTGDLAVMSPGREAPEAIDGSPTFVWSDDSAETHYELMVFDALGNLTWEQAMVAEVSGMETVEVPYAGPALAVGMYYQFRATAFRETPQGTEAISRTEDLRGVFVFRGP